MSNKNNNVPATVRAPPPRRTMRNNNKNNRPPTTKPMTKKNNKNNRPPTTKPMTKKNNKENRAPTTRPATKKNNNGNNRIIKTNNRAAPSYPNNNNYSEGAAVRRIAAERGYGLYGPGEEERIDNYLLSLPNIDPEFRKHLLDRKRRHALAKGLPVEELEPEPPMQHVQIFQENQGH
jgi:hypothetical protein